MATEEELPEAAPAPTPAPTAAGGGGGDNAEMSDAAAPSYSDSSDSDSDSELRIQALEKTLQERPYDYESHVQYIQCLRKSGNIEKLRTAREKMWNYFPLTPKMWQEWAKDEITLSSSEEYFRYIENLYKHGVQEYLSIELWQEYLDYVEEHDQSVSQCTPSGLSKMRNLFESAITAGGLHVTEGSKLWAAYREYEMAILATIADANDKERKKQVQFMRKLFLRQLSVPLADMESTLAEYKSWEAEQGNANCVPSNVLSIYKKANDMYNERKQYEDHLSVAGTSEADKLQEFMKYIKFEECNGDSARVQVLYERAVSEFPVSSDIWMRYTCYMDRTLKLPSLLKSIHYRAIRNCTWVGELWVHYLLSLEHIGASEYEMKQVFDCARQCSFSTIQEHLNIYLTRVHGLTRRISVGQSLEFTLIRHTFMDAVESLASLLDTKQLLRLYDYWAKLERSLGKDLSTAMPRYVWEDAIKKRGNVFEVWEKYISMEIETGHVPEARLLYKRCYSNRFADSRPEEVCHSWIRFEEENGTLDDYDDAMEKVRLLMMFMSQEEAKVEACPNLNDNSDANDSSQKRKRNKMASKQQSPDQTGHSGAVTAVEVGDASREKVVASMEIKVNGDCQIGKSSSSAPKPSFYTVLLSDIDLEANEDDIRKFFKDIGGAKAIRLLRHRVTKSSRGLAFVDFPDTKHLEAALQKNKQVLRGKEVSISQSVSSKPKKKMKPKGKKIRQVRQRTQGSSGPDDEGPKGDAKTTGNVTRFIPRAVVYPG